MKIGKLDPQTFTSASDIPKRYYAFQKNNKPDGKYLVIEVWGDGHPDKAERKLLEIDTEAFSIDETKLDSMLAYWEEVARGAGFENPILTIQGDIGNGSELSYGYKDGRNEIPPNGKFYTIKPVFDKNITIVRHGGKQGKSLVYHSPLNSTTLREELTNFNKLLIRFFNGEFYELLTEHSDKGMGWEFAREVVADNAKLRKSEIWSLIKEIAEIAKKEGYVTWPILHEELRISYAGVVKRLNYMVKQKILLPPDESGKYFLADDN